MSSNDFTADYAAASIPSNVIGMKKKPEASHFLNTYRLPKVIAEKLVPELSKFEGLSIGDIFEQLTTETTGVNKDGKEVTVKAKPQRLTGTIALGNGNNKQLNKLIANHDANDGEPEMVILIGFVNSASPEEPEVLLD